MHRDTPAFCSTLIYSEGQALNIYILVQNDGDIGYWMCKQFDYDVLYMFLDIHTVYHDTEKKDRQTTMTYICSRSQKW